MEEIDFRIKDICVILKSKWKIIASITSAVTLLVGVITFFVIKPVYETNTKVFIGKDQIHNYYQDYEMNDVMMYQNLLKTYSEVIKSTDLIENAIYKSGLDITPEELINGLEVTPKVDTQVMEISYKNNNNQLAKDILESVVNEFMIDTKELIPNAKVKVIESAKLPEYPTSPNKVKNIAIAFLLGLIIGSIIALFLDYMDDTLKTKEQTEKIMEIPVIGMIPCEDKNNTRSKEKHLKTTIIA
ncbi:Wzz/FepE/Etk N-terminal domain-containing protein [Clostridium sp. C2-6-12]|uniref:YveK family protein n=1 Tax=Clostridium sp. C2-6-12 TaxID=2698832 RepID=UPI0013699857|nr:Wzz/FepE/Etk N-terminal domain-containing protein [Clostridium sp. C2-6-12]